MTSTSKMGELSIHGSICSKEEGVAILDADTALTWKEQTGRIWKINEMETRHLFFSVKMLWNHFCPDDLQLHPFRRYNIRMRKEYIISRMRAMLLELSHRDDLLEPWIVDLNFMVQNIKHWRKDASYRLHQRSQTEGCNREGGRNS